MSNHYDVIWIGTGQATMTVVPRLLSTGKSVAVVEGGKFGGTCVNYGCTPTKTLVASAYAIHMARRGDEFGFRVPSVDVDFAKVMEPQQSNRVSSSSWIEDRLRSLDGSAVFNEFGEFVDEKTIRIGDHQITGDAIVIHVGTRPRKPNVKGIDSIDWLTNESLLDLKELPEHLAIVGGSYIALEFAQIFRRLGSKVTILNRAAQLVPRKDEDIAELVEEVLSGEGIEVLSNTSIDEVAPHRDGVEISAGVDGQAKTIHATHVLFAIGRIPNSDRVNAAAAGLNLLPSGHIEVDDMTRTNVPHIFALGDVNGRGAFTHTAVNDGEIFCDAYCRALGVNREPEELDRTISMRTVVYSMFIDPPLARVGMNETEARASKRSVLMATMPMRGIARAREKRETSGMVKLLVDRDTEEILGATVFGTGGDEVIGAFAAFIQTRSSYRIFRRVVFPHPTVSELMPWCLDNLKPLCS